MVRHIFGIAAIALLMAVSYIIVVASTTKQTAQSVGVGYVVVIVTISFLWEVIHHHTNRRGHDG